MNVVVYKNFFTIFSRDDCILTINRQQSCKTLQKHGLIDNKLKHEWIETK